MIEPTHDELLVGYVTRGQVNVSRVTRLIERHDISIPKHEDDGERRMRNAQMPRKLITEDIVTH